MRNLKKIIAVLVTLSMLLAAFTLTATAADVKVTLTGRTQMEAGDSYFADLKVEGTTGGIQGTITYDTEKLDYVGVEYSDAFEAANAGLDEVAAVSEKDGVITFVGLNPGSDKVWFTLEFKVDTEGEVAVGDAFTVKASNTAGTGTVTAEVVGASVEAVAPDQVDMLGATIKTTADADKQDLMMVATVNKEGATIVEYGVIFIPTHLLKGAELNCDPDYVYGTNSKGNPIKAAVATSTGASLRTNVDLYATLGGSASYKSGALLQVDITSRAYIKLSDGTVIYSNNNETDPAVIDNGYAVKSIIGVAKSIANNIKDVADYSAETFENKEALEAVINATGTLDDDVESKLLAFVKANESKIQA